MRGVGGEGRVVAAKPKGSGQRVTVKVEERDVVLSNLDKVLYPKAGFTKGEVIDYYVRVGPAMLPHLRDRPLTLKRYPNGVEGEYFYQKERPEGTPEWVPRAPVPSDRRSGDIDYVVCNDLPTLVWLANLANLEFHPLLFRRTRMGVPLHVVFDLDPGPGAGLVECARVALLLRETLKGLGLKTLAKTSGGKGLQVYVPLNTTTTHDAAKTFSHAVARAIEKDQPDLVVSRMQKELRKGKVLIDWSQNDEHKSTVAPYSLRAKEHPSVSTPVTWKGVEETVTSGEPDVLVFMWDDVLDRVRKRGDMFEPLLTLKQKLPT